MTGKVIPFPKPFTLANVLKGLAAARRKRQEKPMPFVVDPADLHAGGAGIDWDKHRRETAQKLNAHYNGAIEGALQKLIEIGVPQGDISMEVHPSDLAQRTVICVRGAPRYEVTLTCKDQTFTVTQRALA